MPQEYLTFGALQNSAPFLFCQIPIDRPDTMLFQIGVGFGKMAAAEKAVESGKRGRVRAFQNQMLVRIDERLFAPRISAPENKDDVFLFFGNQLNYAVRKKGPAAFGMGIRPMGAHREGSVHH